MHDPLWTTADGRQLRICQMEDTHLERCIAKIRRSRRGWRVEFLPRLELEVEIRRMGLSSSA